MPHSCKFYCQWNKEKDKVEKMLSEISDLKNQLMEAHSQIDQKEKGKEDLERSVRGLREELETTNGKLKKWRGRYQ